MRKPLVLFGSLILCAISPLMSGEIFVSPTGISSGSGSISSPVSLQEAQSRARSQAATQSEEIYVTLRGGTYQLSAPMNFTSADSGRNGFKVHYRAYNTEVPIVSGGQIIGNWTAVAGKPGTYSTTQLQSDTRQLYLDRTRLTRGRSYILTESQVATAPLTINGTTGYSNSGPGFFVPDDTGTTVLPLHQWADLSSVEFVYGMQWSQHRVRVQSATSTAITMSQPAFQRLTTAGATGSHINYSSPAKYPDTFYVENALELVDAPGEWYFKNSGTKTLYLKAPANINLTSGNPPVVAPVLASLFNLDGAKSIRFSGIQFSYATWLGPNSANGYTEVQAGFGITSLNQDPMIAPSRMPGALNLIRSEFIEIVNCTLCHLGGVGIDIDEASKDNKVEANVFYDISGSAIQLGQVSTLTKYYDTTGIYSVSRNKVLSNYIRDVGREFEGAIGIFVGWSDFTEIKNNEIYNVPYTGISIGWGLSPYYGHPSNNKIEKNNINRHMQKRLDGGGIYTNGAQSLPPAPRTAITGNAILNAGNGHLQLYFDGGSRSINATGNLVFNSSVGYSFDIGGNDNESIDVSGNYFQGDYLGGMDHLFLTATGSKLTATQLLARSMVITPNTQITDLTPSAVTSILSNSGLGAYSGIRSRVVKNQNLEGRISNLSLRGRVDSSANVTIGFVISGSSNKQVLIRAIGPGLSPYLPPGSYHTDPVLTLYNSSSTQLQQNNNWGAVPAEAAAIAAASAQVGAFALVSNSADSAMLVNLSPGLYTAVVSSGGGAQFGDVLLELYETDASSNPSVFFTNSSGRVKIAPMGNATLGFIVGGVTPRTYVVRAVGPTLLNFGLTDVLANPRLRLYAGSQLLAENNNWKDYYSIHRYDQVAKLSKDVGAFPLTSIDESAILVTLQPGAYTAVLDDILGLGKTALLEIYNVDP